MPAITGMPISAKSDVARRRPSAPCGDPFSPASAAAMSRRDTSMRAPSASVPAIRPRARSRSISASWSRYTATSALPASRSRPRESGHSTARIAAPVMRARRSQSSIRLVLVEGGGRGQKAIKRRPVKPCMAEQSGVSAARVAGLKTQKPRRSREGAPGLGDCRWSGDGGPGAVGLAAGDAAAGLRAALDVDGVGVFAAALVALIGIGRTRHHGAVGAAPTPSNGGAGTAAFECVHLGGIGAAAILLVEGVADGAADKAADHSTRDHAADATAGGGADQAAGERTEADTGSG